MFYILFALAVSAAVAGEIYDVTLSERGIKSGVAVEGNDFLVGPKPSALALYLRDSLFIAPFVALPLICHLVGNDPLAYGTLAGPVVACVKHVLGGLKWKKLGV